ncbi:MAG: tetratricopeptide repeat-containing diguanylate cyclase [Mobilitalea sp.]
MGFEEYDVFDENITEWMSQVLATRTRKTSLTKKYCKDLLQAGKESKNDKLIGFAYFHLAEAYFVENKYDKFIRNLLLGLPYLQEMSLKNLLARAYNLLGVNSDTHGYTTSALDYYLVSLKYSLDYGLNYEAGLTNNNIGQIYLTLHEYQTAISYFQEACRCFNKDKEHQFYERNLVLAELSIGISYYRLKKMQLALPYFNKIVKDRDKYLSDTYCQISIYIFEVVFYNALKDFEKRDELINIVLSIIPEYPSLVDYYDEISILCELLLELERYQDLRNVLEHMENLAKLTNLTNIHLRVLKMKIKDYRVLNDEEGYLQATSDFYLLSEQLEEENIVRVKESIKLRMDLEEIKKKQTLVQEENRILLLKSETDALTNLPNRNKLNDYSDAAFERAYNNETNLAVEILDIDCFKQYNDTYGHQAGDECLIKISQLLQKLVRENIFCARYGGDEFIIIYENMTDEEILTIARKLQQDIIDLNIENKNSTAYPVVTITQGIRNSIPRKSNKIWDYLYVADMRLYQMKRASKNDIGLSHTTKELGITIT